jgi:phage tail sheath gpL-like
MTQISNAVGLERKSRVSGYKIKKGFFGDTTPNLPQLIAVFGEANTANQAGLSVDKVEVTSAKEAATLYGYGSPIHQQMRILRPSGSDGVGGVPTIIFPQITDAAATSTSRVWTIAGTATANATHTAIIAGRTGLDFQNYSYTVNIGDTASVIAAKVVDAISGVLSTPVLATSAAGIVTFESKWKGLTSASLIVTFDNGNVDAGITYSETASTDGAGDVDLAATLTQFQEDWYTIVLNPYGADESILAALEVFNGAPTETPTGRYGSTVFRPFIALFGSVLSTKAALSAITNDADRIEQVTNVLCPAPNSSGFPSEAAANVCLLFSRIAQDTPHLDINGQSYPDMPAPLNGSIGEMADYNNRDFLVKNGCSTVSFNNAAYQVQDLVTTYHPDGETPLQFAYPRNLNLDWNIKYGYTALESVNVKDHVLVDDGQVTDALKSVKPKQWAAVLYDYFSDLAERALIREPEFSKESLIVMINEVNPDRFDTSFRYKRTGVARIESTTVEAGF